ncbi:MAG: heparinase II/III family protein, partial [Acidimicrobiales bacterium]
MKISEIPVFLRTVRHIPPKQIYHRVRLRTKRAYYLRFPNGLEERWAKDVPETGSWPEDFVPIDWNVEHEAPRHTEFGRGEIHMVGEVHDVFAGGWRPQERSQLFRYHLHYFEWAWPMAKEGGQQNRDDFGTLWKSWRANTQVGRWDEWSPYVVSLRAWVLCGVFDSLVRGSEIEPDVLKVLQLSAQLLKNNLEKDVGGNHLLKNLKALVGLADFLKRNDFVKNSQMFDAEVARQVLQDGGHYELSPSYHAQVLADTCDVRDLVEASGHKIHSMDAIVESMVHWLDCITYPDATLPRFGDCVQPPAGLVEVLLARSNREAGRLPRLRVLAASGYVIWAPSATWMVVADLGQAGPPELPAHIQSDWGSFELWDSGQLLIADPGTTSYVGERRAWERSSNSHNVPTPVDGDWAEVWSSFRVGGLFSASPIEVEGTPSAPTAKARIRSWSARGAAWQLQREFTFDQSGFTVCDLNLGRKGYLCSVTCPASAAIAWSDCADNLPIMNDVVSVARSFGELEEAARFVWALPAFGCTTMTASLAGQLSRIDRRQWVLSVAGIAGAHQNE